MSSQLKAAGELILHMGYYKNDNARSGNYNPGHEAAVAAVLSECGFQGFVQSDFPQLRRKHLKEWWENEFGNQLDDILSDMPPGSYILQPGGSQSFPDILVKDFGGKIVAVECKSAKGTHPMWNDSTPKLGAVYIMSSSKANETTMFMGEDLISKETLSHFTQALAKMYAIADTFNDLAKGADVHMSGFKITCRKQFFQAGGGAKTNYFTHGSRYCRESNVLNLLGQ